MTTMELRTSILKDIASLLNNDEAMIKLHQYIRSLKQEVRAEKTASGKFKKELKQELQTALQEVRDMQAGKVELGTMDDLYAELAAEK